jgi:hypothetical protein
MIDRLQVCVIKGKWKINFCNKYGFDDLVNKLDGTEYLSMNGKD